MRREVKRESPPGCDGGRKDSVYEVISNNVGAGCFLLSRLCISSSPTHQLSVNHLLKVFTKSQYLLDLDTT